MDHDGYETLLSQTYDAQYGQARTPSGDVDFYGALADEAGGPVLELGCGTGRVLLPIAAAGHRCVGVDPSPAMLAKLADHGPPATLTTVLGSAQTLELAQRDFTLATMPFRSFMHLETVTDQQAALARVHGHLAPGGWLALDVFEPALGRLDATEESGSEHPFRWEGRRVVRHYAVSRQHHLQLQRVAFRYEDADSGELLGRGDIAMRWTYRYELEHLLVRCGFEPFRWASGFRGEPYASGGSEIVVVARKAGG